MLSPLAVNIWCSSGYTLCVKMCSCVLVPAVFIVSLLVDSTVRAVALETRKSIPTKQKDTP